ncbi:hypothetical protein MOKP20_07430 [Mycobacterium avium subsp. hominissuis]
MPNRRRRKLSTAMSAVAALAVASPCAYFLVYESTAGNKAPEHHEFKQAAVMSDLPGELMGALSQGLSQFGINLPPVPALSGGATSTPGLASPGLGSPGLGSPGLGTPGLGTPGLTNPGLTSPGATSPGLTSPGLTSPGLTSPGLTSPGAAPTTPGLTAPGALPTTPGGGVATPGAGLNPALSNPGLTSPRPGRRRGWAARPWRRVRCRSTPGPAWTRAPVARTRSWATRRPSVTPRRSAAVAPVWAAARARVAAAAWSTT